MNTKHRTHLAIKLGHTAPEQCHTLQLIKDAMAMAIISRWEAGTAAPDDPCCATCSTIYLEANTHLYQLQNNIL